MQQGGEGAPSLYLNDGWSLPDSSHDVAPSGIHLAEGAALLGNLLHDLLRAEYGLQVQPLALSQIGKMPSVMASIACLWRLNMHLDRAMTSMHSSWLANLFEH